MIYNWISTNIYKLYNWAVFKCSISTYIYCMEGLYFDNFTKFLEFRRFMKVRTIGMVDLGEGERFVVMPRLVTI